MQAQKEMEAKDSKCDMTFQLETIKEGKKITRLRFIIMKRNVEQSPPEQPIKKKQAPPAQTANKQPPLSAEMKEFKKHLEKIGDSFLLDTLKTQGPQEFMVRAAFADWQRAQA